MPASTSINFWNKDRRCTVSAKGKIALFYAPYIYCMDRKMSSLKESVITIFSLGLLRLD